MASRKTRWAVIIVGAGPAGTATALHVTARMPELAERVLLIDKSVHPRTKVCAGGLIPATLENLRTLGIDCAVPHATVEEARVWTANGVLSYRRPGLCTVVRRQEFDAMLVRACERRGVHFRGGEKVLGLSRDADGVWVHTEHQSYLTSVVVGADGSGSVVRRSLLPGNDKAQARGVMVDVPLDRVSWDGWPNRFEFDFLDVQRGLPGYGWVFPCWIDGRPHVNVGVYSLRSVGSAHLVKHALERLLNRLGARDVAKYQAAPIRWWSGEGQLVGDRVLLVGDAAGVDALLGEGISYAFEYGRWAAGAIESAFADRQFHFAHAGRQFERSWVGRKLRRLAWLAECFYGPRSWLWFAFAARSPGLRELGVRWYNGLDNWDRRSGWEALREWWRGKLCPEADGPEEQSRAKS